MHDKVIAIARQKQDTSKVELRNKHVMLSPSLRDQNIFTVCREILQASTQLPSNELNFVSGLSLRQILHILLLFTNCDDVSKLDKLNKAMVTLVVQYQFYVACSHIKSGHELAEVRKLAKSYLARLRPYESTPFATGKQPSTGTRRV